MKKSTSSSSQVQRIHEEALKLLERGNLTKEQRDGLSRIARDAFELREAIRRAKTVEQRESVSRSFKEFLLRLVTWLGRKYVGDVLGELEQVQEGEEDEIESV